MPTELLQRLALDPELTMPMVLPLRRNMVLPPPTALGLVQEKLPSRRQENMELPQLRNTEPLPLKPQGLAKLSKLQESMAPLPMTHMVLLPRPQALALARSPPTPMLPLLLMRMPSGVDARVSELEPPGVAKHSVEVVARRTNLPRRARAAATRQPGRAASSRGSQSSSRGGQLEEQARGSSRGVDVDSSPSPSPTGAHTGMPLPSATPDVASRLRLTHPHPRPPQGP